MTLEGAALALVLPVWLAAVAVLISRRDPIFTDDRKQLDALILTPRQEQQIHAAARVIRFPESKA